MLPSPQRTREIEQSEIDYMTDRMVAIRNRPHNPEGIEIEKFGSAVCFYSKTMPWASFNTVKGLTHDDKNFIEPILHYYQARDRKVQFEIIPSRVDQPFLQKMADCGLYQSGFHCSLAIETEEFVKDAKEDIRIEELLHEDQFDLYAAIHCLGTGLGDNGIPHVAANYKVLCNRPGWKFYIAYIDDTPAAAGVMFIKDRIASLTFAATLPEFRNRGLHQALLKKRIAAAKQSECKLAVSQCSYLTQSHRNMEHVGMKLGYIRSAWTER